MTQASTLLPLEQALETLLSETPALSRTETMMIGELRGRVAAQDVFANITQPPFDNSAVDGYACRIEDLKANQSESGLPIKLRVAAGDPPNILEPGSAARIFTGAPVPSGADCVIMQEDIELVPTQDENNGAMTMKLSGGADAVRQLRQEQNIRPAGQDFKSGQRILQKGHVIQPQNIGLLASAGVDKVRVYAPLQIAIMSTGDELAEPGESLQPGQIYNSNAYMMQALIESLGMKVSNVGCIEDTLEATIEALQKASEADIILTSGGASVGEEDYIKLAIEQLGSVNFWRIALKPGKPLMFGKIKDKPVLGLPGNPSAVLVTFLMLARPLLLQRQGCRALFPKPQLLPLAEPIRKAGKRREFLRVRVNEDGFLVRHSNQSSGMLSSACWAEGFAIIYENTAPDRGDLVNFVPYAVLMQLPNDAMEIE